MEDAVEIILSEIIILLVRNNKFGHAARLSVRLLVHLFQLQILNGLTFHLEFLRVYGLLIGVAR